MGTGFRALRLTASVMVLFLAGVAVSCGGGDASGPSEKPPGPGFMVGDWIAKALVVTSVANPEVSIDLTAAGAIFTLSVQPSGRYTAILSGFGQASSESGTLSVEGPQVVFRRTVPSQEVSRSTWVRDGADVTLTGPTEFDLNLDGTTEDATIVIGLTPR
ncbi:MAG: hypothetical protein BMS9Abin29_1783 [Gemmatimonadota bacterium]|nr:MAG: hypothetical protein BMS9Abin29_1783 [Gemmatimonadota bacterium]